MTVIICTYAREELLQLTLQTLNRQQLDRRYWEVMIVDNVGRSQTKEIAHNWGIRYIHEPQEGLSHARNRGYKEASTEWVVYLDDDVQAPDTLLEAFHRCMLATDCAAVGGYFKHWFRTPPPDWLSKYYADPYRATNATVRTRLPEGKYLPGCVMGVRRTVLEEVGGFDPRLGMQGESIGHAEEDYLQDVIRERGYGVLFDPDIWLDHLVQPYKYSLIAQYQMAYSHGRASVFLDSEEAGTTWYGFLAVYARITLYSVPFNFARWCLKPGYVWQHLLVDSLTKYCYAWGRYTASWDKA